MNYTIRKESKNDYSEIYNLIETAFQTARVKDGTEQDFATDLRNGGCYINELALVAETDGKIIGHIMSTDTYVTMSGEAKFPALMIAPLSVALEYRDHGIGGALLRRSFEIAREMGYQAMFLCGDPNYYSRFGFRPIGDFGITHASIPAPYVMGYELIPATLNNISGIVRVE